jgi:hypothetical protein
MNFWRINTDSNTRDDLRTCDLWYRFGMVFTGDLAGGERTHDAVLRKLIPGDGVFMHHSGLGIVGYGIVRERWDRKLYQGSERQLYIKEPFEYRIAVDWQSNYDCRRNPVPVASKLPYMGTYSCVNPRKWDVQSILRELHERASTGSEHNNSANQSPEDSTGRKEAASNVPGDEICRILSCIGRKVSFKYPANEGDKQGILKDRVVIESMNQPGSVPYWDVVDLIEFKGEQESEWIRIGYYRKPGKTLNWGSQTTITEPTSVWKRILVNAAREKDWFRDLLKGVLEELDEE